MKAKDGIRVSVLRFLFAGIKNREIEIRAPLEEDQILAEIASSVKRRRESVEAFLQGERQDLVDKEQAEIAILTEYLPQQLSEEEIRSLVAEAIAAAGASKPSDMGAVMKELMPRVRGRADGKLVNAIVRELLAG